MTSRKQAASKKTRRRRGGNQASAEIPKEKWDATTPDLPSSETRPPMHRDFARYLSVLVGEFNSMIRQKNAARLLFDPGRGCDEVLSQMLPALLASKGWNIECESVRQMRTHFGPERYQIIRELARHIHRAGEQTVDRITAGMSPRRREIAKATIALLALDSLVSDLSRSSNYLLCVALGPVDKAEGIFGEIVRMKGRAERGSPRLSQAMHAYHDYICETGREPAKPELKEYILARREAYGDMPAKGDGKGWTRVWEDAGLSTLRDRKTKRTPGNEKISQPSKPGLTHYGTIWHELWERMARDLTR